MFIFKKKKYYFKHYVLTIHFKNMKKSNNDNKHININNLN
jgi:hypothetical protein